MNSDIFTVQDWLSDNQDGIVHCPHQPGGLMISKSACRKRHLAAQKDVDVDNAKKDDIFIYNLKKGLSLCRECIIGKKLAGVSVASRSDRKQKDRKRLLRQGRP